MCPLKSQQEPGGYLQWDEYTYTAQEAVHSRPSPPPGSATPSIEYVFESMTGFRGPYTLFDSLPEYFKSHPGVDSSSVILDLRTPRDEILMAFHEYWMSWTAQMLEVFANLDPERGQRLRKIRERIFTEELANGIISCTVPRVTLGRKKEKA